MGKITEYTPIGGAPDAGDMLFIADINGAPANQIKSITIANLNKMVDLAAKNSSGLSIKDDGNNYGIIINDGGNVGIGPGASPSSTSRLDVRGTTGDTTIAQFFNATATDDGDITQILVGTDRASFKSLALRYTYDTTANDGLITLRHFEDAIEGIHLKGDGNVGIGQTAPTSKLHIGNGSATPALRVEGSSYDVFLYSDGTNGPGLKGGSGHSLHIQRGYGGASGKDLVCFYSTSDPVTPLMIQSSDGNVGIGTNSPSGTVEISSKVDDALFIYSRDSGKSARIRLLTTSGTNSYIQDMSTGAGFVAIGGTSSISASNCLQIAKTNGRISIGGVLGTFDYAITTASSPATQAYFSNGNGTKAHIYITNTTSGVCSGAVVFGNETVGNKARWMCGQFWTGTPSHNYFGMTYLGGSSKTPETAAFNGGTLEDTTVYISETGGMTSENTSVAFGHITTNNSTSTAILTGTYNIESPVTLSAGGVATITFKKTLTSASYTVIATGWDGTRPLVGRASTKADTSVAITFYRLDTGAVIDLTTATICGLDFVVYGGISSGVSGAQTRLEKA